jgi:hypothetical protein
MIPPKLLDFAVNFMCRPTKLYRPTVRVSVDEGCGQNNKMAFRSEISYGDALRGRAHKNQHKLFIFILETLASKWLRNAIHLFKLSNDNAVFS